MTIKELKSLIESKQLMQGTNVWVAKSESAKFIAWKYIKYLDRPVKIINSIDEINDDSFFEDDNVYVMINPKDIPNHDNLVVLLEEEPTIDHVVIPTLEDWQFTDYLKAKVPGMNPSDIDYLMHLYATTNHKVTAVNYQRLDNDTDKIALYDASMQDMIFDELYKAGEFDTVSNLTMFDLSNAIIKRDVKTASAVLKVRDFIDLSPGLWLLSILLTNFRNIIAIQIGNRSAADLGISDKQHWFIKKNQVGLYTNNQLVEIYSILTNIEYQFKFEGLSVDSIIDYIILKIFSVGRVK